MNKSKTYILPLIGDYVPLTHELLKFLWDTYLFYDDEDESDPAVLYLEVSDKFKDLSNYNTIHNSFIENDHFVKYFEDYVYNMFFIYYVFKIPEIFLDDYYTLLKGHYSMISESAKDVIRAHLNKFYPHKKETIEYIWKVLTKDVSLKLELEDALHTVLPENVELADKFNTKKETLEV